MVAPLLNSIVYRSGSASPNSIFYTLGRSDCLRRKKLGARQVVRNCIRTPSSKISNVHVAFYLGEGPPRIEFDS